jgi:type IV pilus assembly protein PilC
MQFTYTAIKDGATIKGKIESESKGKAVEYLKSKDYFIVNISEQEDILKTLSNKYLVKVSENDVVDFTRQLAIMLNAGLTIVDALEILIKQSENVALVTVLKVIDQDVRSGSNFSSSLKKFPQYFSNLYISLIRAGEASGKLDEIMLKLADNLEKARGFKSKIKGALIYPVIVISTMFIVMFIVVTFVIPKLLGLYKDFGVELPLSTQILMGLSSFFQMFWPLIIVAVLGAISGIKTYIGTKKGRLQYDQILLKLPVVNNIIKMSALVDTTRTFSILIGAGVSILEALEIVVDTATNVVYQEAFREIYSKIEKGQSLGKSFEDAGIFPPILVQMATVGEQTGHLDETLLRISAYFEMESELAVKSLVTMIEPAILIVMGLAVGVFVTAVITPIYSLTNSFK